MTAHSSSAYTLSLLLHGGFVALLFLAALVMQGARMLEKKPQIFELVAGEGDNFSALEAPALGSPSGVKIDIPQAPVITPAREPEPEPAPVAPAPEPIQAVKPEPAKPVKAPKKELSLAEKVEKISDQREKRIITKYRKEQERLEKIRAAEEAKRISKAEFDRANAGSAAGKKGPRIDAEGIAKGVVGGSTRNKTGGAGGKALTRDEMDKVSEYFSILAQKIQRALEAEGADPALRAQVRLVIASTGGLGTPTITRSSGNAEFDAAVIRAIRSVGSVGRPHPLGRTETLEFYASTSDD